MTQSTLWKYFPIIAGFAVALSITHKNEQKNTLGNLIKIADEGLLKIERKTSRGDSIFTLKDASNHTVCEIRLPDSLLKDIEIKAGIQAKTSFTADDIRLIEDTCKTVILNKRNLIRVEGSESLSRYIDSFTNQTPYTQITSLPGNNGFDPARLKHEIEGKGISL